MSASGTKRQSRRISGPGPLLGVDLSRAVAAGRDGGSSVLAESARGSSPRASHRTIRKPLDLYGSCHRAKAAAFR